jgi:hypothetical protein
MTEKMTIGRLADAAGVNVESVRFYQRSGLIDVSVVSAPCRHSTSIFFRLDNPWIVVRYSASAFARRNSDYFFNDPI